MSILQLKFAILLLLVIVIVGGEGSGMAGEKTIEMSVATVAIDPHTRAPVVVLKGEEGTVLPIVIGTAEARAITLALNRVSVPRPMTHDLMSSLIEKLGASVSKIFIHDLRDGIFFTQIILIKNEKELILDSRPSDAIALALRVNAPIIVAEKIVTKITIPEVEVERRLRI
jgi:bifunctional DNase/RNase